MSAFMTLTIVILPFIIGLFVIARMIKQAELESYIDKN